MWDDPVRDPWVLSAVLLVGLALFGPVIIMMGRDMFGRRKQGTTMSDEPVTEVIPTAPVIPRNSPFSQLETKTASTVGFTTASINSREAFEVSESEEERQAEARWAAEGIPVAGRPPERDRLLTPAPLISPSRIDCEHCGGRGFMPGINDLLQESAALLGDQGDEVIRMFYSALLRANPQLMTLFPGDPTQGDFGSDHKGAIQRDRLLKALTALAGLYDPGDPEKMAHLDQALATFGRAHASFVRQDGTIRGATLEEYAAVKEALFTTLVSVAADKWKTEYSSAWSQAYDYATAVMLAEQFRSGFSAPRFARTAQG